MLFVGLLLVVVVQNSCVNDDVVNDSMTSCYCEHYVMCAASQQVFE